LRVYGLFLLFVDKWGNMRLEKVILQLGGNEERENIESPTLAQKKKEKKYATRMGSLKVPCPCRRFYHLALKLTFAWNGEEASTS
jgi:hypothetical protein